MPKLDEGASVEINVYNLTGRSIYLWNTLENYLIHFSGLLGPNSDSSKLDVLRLTSCPQRIDALKAMLLNSSFSSKLKSDILQVLNAIRKEKKDLRNELVHGFCGHDIEMFGSHRRDIAVLRFWHEDRASGRAKYVTNKILWKSIKGQNDRIWNLYLALCEFPGRMSEERNAQTKA